VGVAVAVGIFVAVGCGVAVAVGTVGASPHETRGIVRRRIRKIVFIRYPLILGSGSM